MIEVKMQHRLGRGKVRGLLAACVLAAVTSAAIGSAQAGGFVVVNGKLLSPVELALAEALHCGPIANGYYRYNPSTGAWGYANDLWARGNIRDNCYVSRNVPQRSLSQRRQLFQPGELAGVEVIGGRR